MSGATKLLTPGGGGVLLTPASSIASDVIVNLPTAVNGATLAVNGPAFGVWQASAQSISNNTATKILFDTVEFDTNNNFSGSRFTPTVAGYYQINGSLQIAATGTYFLVAYLYKNGNIVRSGPLINANVSAFPTANVSSMVYMNGTTDYLEIYGFQFSGFTQNTGTSYYETYFNGSLVRAA